LIWAVDGIAIDGEPWNYEDEELSILVRQRPATDDQRLDREDR